MATKELIVVFGQRQQNEWKANVSEILTYVHHIELGKLYLDVYAHLLNNVDYPTIFLRNWLAQWNDLKVNWVKHASKTTQNQLKRATRLTPLQIQNLVQQNKTTHTRQAMEFYATW